MLMGTLQYRQLLKYSCQVRSSVVTSQWSLCNDALAVHGGMTNVALNARFASLYAPQQLFQRRDVVETLSSVEESTARLFRQSKMTSILVVELHGSPLSPSAHPHVLAANACTFDCADVSQFVQLIIFLVYWSGAKNNLPPGYLNLFHRFESMRTLRICKRILKLDNKRIRSVCLFLCACKHVVV